MAATSLAVRARVCSLCASLPVIKVSESDRHAGVPHIFTELPTRYQSPGIMDTAANKTVPSSHGGSILIGEDNTELNEQDSFR